MSLFHSVKIIFTSFILILFSACVSKKLLVQEVKINTTDVNELLKSNYMPSEKDMQLIMKNSNTGYYYSKSDDCNFNPNKIIIKTFEDSLMTIIKPNILIQTFKNKLIMKHEYYASNEVISSLDYIRNDDGLLLKTISKEKGIENYRTEYRYASDKIFKISISGNYITDYDTYFLNEMKQCYRKITQYPNHEIRFDYSYSYDNLGRKISEKDIDNEVSYTYANKTDYFFNTIKRYDLNNKKFILSNEYFKNGNIRTYVGKNENNEITFKSISVTEPNCDTKTYNYNSKNELTYVTMSSLE